MIQDAMRCVDVGAAYYLATRWQHHAGCQREWCTATIGLQGTKVRHKLQNIY